MLPRTSTPHAPSTRRATPPTKRAAATTSQITSPWHTSTLPGLGPACAATCSSAAASFCSGPTASLQGLADTQTAFSGATSRIPARFEVAWRGPRPLSPDASRVSARKGRRARPPGNRTGQEAHSSEVPEPHATFLSCVHRWLDEAPRSLAPLICQRGSASQTLRALHVRAQCCPSSGRFPTWPPPRLARKWRLSTVFPRRSTEMAPRSGLAIEVAVRTPNEIALRAARGKRSPQPVVVPHGEAAARHRARASSSTPSPSATCAPCSSPASRRQTRDDRP